VRFIQLMSLEKENQSQLTCKAMVDHLQSLKIIFIVGER